MKKFFLFLGLILVYSFLAIAMNNRISKERLEGKWNVKVAEAPHGYQDYVMDIKEDKGEYTIDVLFVGSDNKISGRQLSLKDGKLIGNVIVDGERIDLTIWEEKGVVQGTARSAWLGTVNLNFSRP